MKLRGWPIRRFLRRIPIARLQAWLTPRDYAPPFTVAHKDRSPAW